MWQSLDGRWMLASDPDNTGRERHWFELGPVPGAEPAAVPGLIQETLTGRHGVFWYWHSFTPQAAPDPSARYMLHFAAVDYLADVWLNGVYLGRHEGAEFPFELDATRAIQAGRENQLVVRVLNPTSEPIDGIKLSETPNHIKIEPWVWGRMWDVGGITQPVALLQVPPLRIADLFVRPDVVSGRVSVEASIQNDSGAPVRGTLWLSVSPARGGSIGEAARCQGEFAPGASALEAELRVPESRPWSPDDPYLYLLSATLKPGRSSPVGSDARSVRFGFRDLRFADGYFRLNGKRIFLRSAHRFNHLLIGAGAARRAAIWRRDFYYAKALGFNMVRFIVGAAYPDQLDLCDEIGLMVYEESYASWLMDDSPFLAERFGRSTSEMVRRDRNHPCVTAWGLLNETHDGPVFHNAVASLPLVRSLDDTRLVFLNSGRWDGQFSIGSLSNPGSMRWEHHLGCEAPDAPDSNLAGRAPDGSRVPDASGYMPGTGDAHFYCPVPQSAESIRFLLTLGQDTKHVFLSEHGNGSEEDPIRITRLLEQAGSRPEHEDHAAYLSQVAPYLADWQRLGLDAIFPVPGDLVRAGQRIQSQLRLVSLNAIRANPNLVGHSLTALGEGAFGEGLWTLFRELKPEIAETMQDAWAPLRWCLFVEPVHGYRGRPFHVEVLLANEDILLPGAYPIKVRLAGPAGSVWERRLTLDVPPRTQGAEPPLVLPVLAEDIQIDGVTGRYTLVAECESGAAPAGGETGFYVSDPAAWPAATARVTLFGGENALGPWLQKYGIRAGRLGDSEPARREVVLVGGPAGAGGDVSDWRELARRLAQGSVALFLTPAALQRAEDALGWLPLATKGMYGDTHGWATGRDDFAKAHPIFDGLPAGGLLDPTYYRELIPACTFSGQETPAELVAGCFAMPFFPTQPPYETGPYYCGMLLAVYPFGAGSFILNAFRITENLGRHPAADRLLLNMIRYAARDVALPAAALPQDFEERLTAIGFC